MEIQIYHNPRCSKSRDSHKLLTEKGLDFQTVEYLKEPPTQAELEAIVEKLGISAFELIRKKEAIFKEQFKHLNPADVDWIQVMVEHPKLIERPIVIKGNKAAIGRPIERILDLLENN